MCGETGVVELEHLIETFSLERNPLEHHRPSSDGGGADVWPITGGAADLLNRDTSVLRLLIRPCTAP